MRPIATNVGDDVSMCLHHTDVLCKKKTAEAIEMPFVGLTHVGSKNQV